MFFIVGMISPKAALFFLKGGRTRGKVALIYGCATLVSFILCGVFSPDPGQQATPVAEQGIVVKDEKGEEQVPKKVQVENTAEEGDKVILDIQGKGNYDSELFKLPKGRVKIKYDVQTNEIGVTALAVYVMDKGAVLFEDGGIPSVNILSQQEKESGETYVRKRSGTYYLGIVAQGSWHIVLSRE